MQGCQHTQPALAPVVCSTHHTREQERYLLHKPQTLSTQPQPVVARCHTRAQSPQHATATAAHLTPQLAVWLQQQFWIFPERSGWVQSPSWVQQQGETLLHLRTMCAPCEQAEALTPIIQPCSHAHAKPPPPATDRCLRKPTGRPNASCTCAYAQPMFQTCPAKHQG